MRLVTPLSPRALRVVAALAAGLLILLPAYPSAQEVEEPAPDPTDERVAAVTEAFAEGDCDALLDLTASRVEIVLLGHGARYSRGQASLVLRDFFRRYPPDRVELSERSVAGDGRAAMGRYWSGNSSAPFTLYVGFRVSADEDEGDDEDWTLEAIRIERASFQRTGTF
ncbi:MAG TPA: DUF4783 domain-containing protein [Rubricoccaceae bacterium]|nr:DUF4783 domain-containing protein [Rubricoccaceae bacterium]